MARAWKSTKVAGLVLAAMAAGAVLCFLVLTRSQLGQTLVLAEVLRRVEPALDGQIVVGGIRSDRGLHREAMLVDVTLRTPEGVDVFRADSLGVRYALSDLVAGDIRLSDVDFWQPVINVARTDSDERFGIQRVLSPPSDGGEGGGGPALFLLERVGVHGGRVEIRDPLPQGVVPGPRTLVEQAPSGDRLLRAMTFGDLEARFDRVSVIDPDADGLEIDIGRLAVLGRFAPEPMEIRELSGRLSLRDGRVSLEADRLRLPQSEASGLATVDFADERGTSVVLDLTAPRLAVEDLRWVLPDMPQATGAGGVGLERDADGLRLRLSEMSVDFGEGGLFGDAVFDWKQGAQTPDLRDVALTLEGLPASIVERMFDLPLPFGGAFDGSIALEGPFREPYVDGRIIHFHPELRISVVDVVGGLLLGQDPGAQELTLEFRPLSLGLVQAYGPGIDPDRTIAGRLDLDGRVESGITVAIDASYPSPTGPDSRLTVEGSVSRVEGELFVDLRGDADPLSFSGLVPEGSPVRRLGVATGALELRGSLSALTLVASLETEGGGLDLTSQFDGRAPLDRYEVTASAEQYDAAALVPALPEGTRLTGRAEVIGEGGGLAEAELTTSVDLWNSRLGALALDTARVSGAVSEGVIRLDELEALLGRATIRGSGSLGTSRGSPQGELGLRIETVDLEGLRPMLLGENPIARDTLSILDREILLLDGIDADTLPLLEEIRMSGRLAGDVTLGGSVDSLSVRGTLALAAATYGTSFIESAAVDFEATGLPSRTPRIEALVETGAVQILDRAFDSASVRVDYREPRGAMDIFLVRSAEEDYRSRIAFESAGDVRILNVDQMVLRFPDGRWNLGGPATVSWDPDGLTLDKLRVIRSDEPGLRLFAEGRLPFRGDADLTVEVEQLDLGRIAHVLQLSERLEGVVDLDLRMLGTAEAPRMSGAVDASRFAFRDFDFDRLASELEYGDRTLSGESEIWLAEREVLRVSGTMPADLAFARTPERFPDEAVDLTVTADSLPLSLLMAPFPTYENVTGTISGSVDFGGTLESLAPSGRLQILDGGAYLEGIGVRHRNLQATLDLQPDGTVAVDATVAARGEAEMTGTITLSPASDPALDLDVRLSNFLALDRRDVQGRLSGEFRLEGSYRRPVVSGDLTVQEGTLYVEEFMRSAEIVDLSDPAFFEVVDTTVVENRPLLAGQNPFLRNIRMENMTLGFERNAWIRSERMNVEMGGELDVLYDRQTQDLALVGNLNAVRGSYSAFGRQFQVGGGTLRFVGTPGINPDLDIQAVNRIRGIDGNALDVTATVTGTLTVPRVHLSSDQAGLAEEDLLSYMYFGVPTYALTTGQTQALGPAGTLLVGSGVTLGLQTFSNALGSAAADLGLAYLSITQQDLSAFGNNSVLGTTILETGVYVTDDTFLTLLLRPLSNQGAGSQFAGIRLEWAASNNYTLEASIEERLFRGRVIGFGELGIQDQKGVGLFLFREWGY